MSGNTKIGLSADLPKETALMINLINALSGEDKAKLAHLKKDELITQLSFLLQCDKEKVANLFSAHDQNQDMDFTNLSRLWKLVKRGVVKAKNSPFASLTEKVYESFKFGEHIRIRNQKLAEIKSSQQGKTQSYIANDRPHLNIKITNQKVDALKYLVQNGATKKQAVSNDWEKLLTNATSSSMVDKVEASRLANDNQIGRAHV